MEFVTKGGWQHLRPRFRVLGRLASAFCYRLDRTYGLPRELVVGCGPSAPHYLANQYDLNKR